jgi:hypothetical protein
MGCIRFLKKPGVPVVVPSIELANRDVHALTVMLQFWVMHTQRPV